MRLQEVEDKIIKLRMEGMSILDCSEKEIDAISEILILNISVISGFKVNPSEMFLNMLSAEIKVLISESRFSNLTFNELVYAFRINARNSFKFIGGHEIFSIKSYTPFLCIDFADKVLTHYKMIRDSIDTRITYEVLNKK